MVNRRWLKDHGHNTKEWEGGWSDPRQDVLCTIAGETVDCNELTYTRHIVTQSPLMDSFWRFILARGLTFYVLVWDSPSIPQELPSREVEGPISVEILIHITM